MNQLWLLSQFNLVSFFILGLSLSIMLVKAVTLCCYLPTVLVTLGLCVVPSSSLKLTCPSSPHCQVTDVMKEDIIGRFGGSARWKHLCLNVDAPLLLCFTVLLFHGGFETKPSSWVWNANLILEVTQIAAFKRWITNLQCKVNLFSWAQRFIWTVYETAVQTILANSTQIK